MNDEQKNFASYYAAKAARDNKARPTDWVILGRGGSHVELVCLAQQPSEEILTLRATAYGLYP